ncbi:hypothetical protein pdam_00013109 [Pocillopora damicornis]|uniref:Uncharacterized protein n=1 Tax=Pocillopora damicornis TaxID=46731 RepID=A0A3M6TWB1_POCDA|nr:hypothetical protein pdam_00013109 [Pocillopora damicornis]
MPHQAQSLRYRKYDPQQKNSTRNAMILSSHVALQLPHKPMKNIEINIIDDEEYEKKETFYVLLGEPKIVKDEDDDSGAGTDVGYDPEKERLEELGKPRLGDVPKAEVTILESKEFKNTVDKLLVKANLALVVGTSSWKEQFTDALTVSGSGDDDDSDEPTTPTYGDYMMHYLTVFWKLLFAIVPPTDIWGGWACFIASIVMIGVLTMVIGDVASHFGCTIGLADSVVAITFVALGTSLPDTFASKVAAVGDEYADSSIGNVTGSNSVNVFLGLGVAWSIAAIAKAARGVKFIVPAVEKPKSPTPTPLKPPWEGTY